ncbi:hypothetical protein FRX31_029879, partial [Thalictrum thalictroides]
MLKAFSTLGLIFIFIQLWLGYSVTGNLDVDVLTHFPKLPKGIRIPPSGPSNREKPPSPFGVEEQFPPFLKLPKGVPIPPPGPSHPPPTPFGKLAK